MRLMVLIIGRDHHRAAEEQCTQMTPLQGDMLCRLHRRGMETQFLLARHTTTTTNATSS